MIFIYIIWWGTIKLQMVINQVGTVNVSLILHNVFNTAFSKINNNTH